MDPRIHVVTYKGETGSIRSICKKFGVNYQMVQTRITKQGMAFEEAMEKPSRRKRLYDVDGNVQTLKDLCEEHKINYDTVKARRSKGMSLEEALKRPLSFTHTGKIYEYNGHKGGISQLCRELGIPYQTVHYKMKNGIPFERAVSECLNRRTQQAT